MITETLYKVLDADGRPCHGGVGAWNLPKRGRPGKWMPVIKQVVPCVSGYHLCRPSDLVHWLGPVIWEVEARGATVEATDKIAVSQARLLRQCTQWNARTARLFAADCAADVLHIIPRPHRAPFAASIAAARDFADELIDGETLAAARDAAEAAGDAAEAAAGAAAGDAARDAAEAAGAAGAAAWSAAAAARAAARDAAEAARAARAAAWDAAWDAAITAARAKQTERLMCILSGGLT